MEVILSILVSFSTLLLGIVAYFLRGILTEFKELVRDFNHTKLELSNLQIEKKNTDEKCSIHTEKLHEIDLSLNNHEKRITHLELVK